MPTATKATSARASRQPAVAPPPARTREGAPVPTLPARAAAVTTLGQVGLRSQSVMPAVNSPAERPLRQEDATDRLRARLLQSQADTDPESQSRKRALFRSVSEIPSRSASRSGSFPVPVIVGVHSDLIFYSQHASGRATAEASEDKERADIYLPTPSKSPPAKLR